MANSMNMLLDVPLKLSVQLGQTKMSVRQLLRLKKGKLVLLDRLSGEAVDVFVDEKLMAKGEITVEVWTDQTKLDEATKVATTKAQRKLFFNLRKAKARLGWFNRDEVASVAKDLKVKPEEVLEMESRLGSFDESFDLSAKDDDDSVYAGPANYLSLGADEDPARLAADEEIKDLSSRGLTRALQSLDERTRDIVESRWLSHEKLGLKVLSEKYGVSMERIRQIESKAFEKMQPFLTV